MKPNIEISEANLKEVAVLLNRLLANEYILYTKTRAAHWNVQGQNFSAMHLFFKEQYEGLDIIVDDTAERVRMLGHFAIGLLKDFLSITDMLEDSSLFGTQKTIVEMLLNDHETIIRIIRNEITPIANKYRDLGTADFVTGLMEQHEKMAWMLRVHLYQS
jgi:starvation-inducible DNA-binding protein